MLLERGPLDLIGHTEIPLRHSTIRLEAAAARERELLEASAIALGAPAGVMASTQGTAGALGALELAAAAREMASQAHDPDSSIGSVAAGADILERELASLTGHLPNEFAAPPTPPGAPARGGDYGTGPPASSGKPDPGGGGGGREPERPRERDPFARQVIALYQEFLLRTPGDDEIEAHRGNPGGIAGVREVILSSDEYRQRIEGGG